MHSRACVCVLCVCVCTCVSQQWSGPLGILLHVLLQVRPTCQFLNACSVACGVYACESVCSGIVMRNWIGGTSCSPCNSTTTLHPYMPQPQPLPDQIAKSPSLDD